LPKRLPYHEINSSTFGPKWKVMGGRIPAVFEVFYCKARPEELSFNALNISIIVLPNILSKFLLVSNPIK